MRSPLQGQQHVKGPESGATGLRRGAWHSMAPQNMGCDASCRGCCRPDVTRAMPEAGYAGGLCKHVIWTGTALPLSNPLLGCCNAGAPTSRVLARAMSLMSAVERECRSPVALAKRVTVDSAGSAGQLQHSRHTGETTFLDFNSACNHGKAQARQFWCITKAEHAKISSLTPAFLAVWTAHWPRFCLSLPTCSIAAGRCSRPAGLAEYLKQKALEGACLP